MARKKFDYLVPTYTLSIPSNEMPFLYSGKRGDSGHNGDGDDRPKGHGDSNE